MADAPLRSNLEFKAKMANEAAEQAALELGAEFSSEMRQADTYFAVHGSRAKLRVIVDTGAPDSSRAELIRYDRSEAAAARVSRYQVKPLAREDAAALLMEHAANARGEVRKTRRVYLWQDSRIHIDRVEGLGEYLEFEVLSQGDAADDHRRMTALLTAFALTESQAIRASYSDLLGL